MEAEGGRFLNMWFGHSEWADFTPGGVGPDRWGRPEPKEDEMQTDWDALERAARSVSLKDVEHGQFVRISFLVVADQGELFLARPGMTPRRISEVGENVEVEGITPGEAWAGAAEEQAMRWK